MKKIKNNYTNFILTVIAVAMIGLLFKDGIIKPAHAITNPPNLAYGLNNLAEQHVTLAHRINDVMNLIMKHCN